MGLRKKVEERKIIKKQKNTNVIVLRVHVYL